MKIRSSGGRSAGVETHVRTPLPQFADVHLQQHFDEQ